MSKAHFVEDPKFSVVGDTVTASGKVAGLGDVPQIHVELSGTAECVNRGGNKPSADNKDEFKVAGDFPVQTGHADFSLELKAVFDPSCSPPMSVEWSGLGIEVQAGDRVLRFP